MYVKTDCHPLGIWIFGCIKRKDCIEEKKTLKQQSLQFYVRSVAGERSHMECAEQRFNIVSSKKMNCIHMWKWSTEYIYQLVKRVVFFFFLSFFLFHRFNGVHVYAIYVKDERVVGKSPTYALWKKLRVEWFPSYQTDLMMAVT